MGIDLVIFDCDGVLVDSESLTTRLIVEHVQRLGLTLDVDDALVRFKGGKFSDVVREVEQALGIPVPETFVDDFRAELFVRLRDEVEAVPGIVAALDAMPYEMCVASNGPMRKMDASLGATGLLARFAGRIFSAYEVGSFKPEPGLFLHAAATLGADPARCVVIEDSVGGVRAGVAAGMAVFAYAAPDADPDEAAAFAAHGSTPFTEMTALPGLLAAHADRAAR